MHILYLSSAGGGLDTNVRELAPALVQAGHRVSVLYIHFPHETCPDSPTEIDGYRVYHARMGGWHYYVHRATFGVGDLGLVVRSLEYIQALSRAVENINARAPIDLIEVPEAFVTPRKVSRIPYVMRLHASAWMYRRMFNEPTLLSDSMQVRWEGDALRGAAGITAPSTHIAEYITQTCHLDQPIEIIPYPIDTTNFVPGSKRAHPPVVFFVGRVEKRKGADVLMQVIPRITAKYADCQFVFAGRVSDELREQVAAMPNGVQFLGVQPRDQLVQWYQLASVFVAPSLWDNSPNTIYEAMACGTPVVASRVGGIPELVDGGVTGLLVPPGDSAALADAIGSVLGDATRREQMGQRARDKVVAEYSVDKIAARTMTFYARVLSG